MGFILHPWQLLLVILAGWVNQQQQQIIEFQRTEIKVLKEKLGKKRIILNDDLSFPENSSEGKGKAQRV